MLKDLIEKNFKKNLKKEKKDKIIFPIMDGFVDIKGYDKNGNMFYHDCGDNVVTDWMRHAIMMMLAGVSFSKNGNMPDFEGHKGTTNPDGYVFNGQQFLAPTPNTTQKYCSSTKGNQYALFPTKILLGTGKEYHDWNTLKTENQAENQAWYNKMLKEYGKSAGEATAKNNFDNNVSIDSNSLSGTLINGIQSGDGLLLKCRTVNDPNSSAINISTAPQMYKNYNVVGAVKTTYTGTIDDSKLNESISESGRLLVPEWKGVGNPCFIYMEQSEVDADESWNSGTSITLGKDKGNRYITKISFKTTLPSQDGEGNVGKYYPYNGWELKQIGLYNDAKIELEPNAKEPSAGTEGYYPYVNMPGGMLLAVKNITPITKTADASYTITWTLTI